MFAPWACGSVDDGGAVCLSPGDAASDPFDPMPEPVSFAAGARLLATVSLTHSGGERLKLRCTLELHGDVIEVSTHYREPPGDPQDDLSWLRAECSLAELPAGTYTVTLRDETQALTVPSTVPPLCFDEY